MWITCGKSLDSGVVKIDVKHYSPIEAKLNRINAHAYDADSIRPGEDMISLPQMSFQANVYELLLHFGR